MRVGGHVLEVVPLDLAFGPIGDFEDGAVHQGIITPKEAEVTRFCPNIALFGRVQDATTRAITRGVPE